MDPLIWQDYAPLAACLAALALVFLLILAGRALIVLARHHDVQALRLVAEQSLAAQHGAQLATEQRLGELTTRIAQEQGETRVLLAQSLRALATDTAAQLEKIRDSVNEQLREAVQRQMQSSFERVIDQFTAVQKAI
jgi:DNA recombination protein RmuC